MEIDPTRQDSEHNMTAAVEAVVKQVAAVEEQVAMIVGPSQSHKKRRVLKELLQSCEVVLQPHPSTLQSSSSHGLNKAASAIARQAAAKSGAIAETRGEPQKPAAKEPAAVDSLSSAHSGTVSRMKRGKRKNTLMF